MGRHAEKESLRRIAASVESLSAEPRERDSGRLRPNERLPIMARFILAVGSSDARTRKAVTIARTYPIRASVGPNGGGKSLHAVRNVLPSLDRGRKVLSTVRLLDSATGEPHRAYEPFYDFEQLLDAHHCDVLMDEVTGIANSREASKLAGRVQNQLVQLRRRDMTLTWTAPNWARADKIIREVTQAVTECRGYYPAKPQADDDGEIRLWAPRRVFRFRTFDTADFEEWTAGKRDKLDPIVSEWFKGVGSRAFASYDTLDAVTTVAGTGDEQCETCGGKVTVRTCRCKAGPTLRQSYTPDTAADLLEAIDAHNHDEHAGGRVIAELGDSSVIV